MERKGLNSNIIQTIDKKAFCEDKNFEKIFTSPFHNDHVFISMIILTH